MIQTQTKIKIVILQLGIINVGVCNSVTNSNNLSFGNTNPQNDENN